MNKSSLTLTDELMRCVDALEASQTLMGSTAFHAARMACRVFKAQVQGSPGPSLFPCEGFANLQELATELRRTSHTVTGRAQKSLLEAHRLSLQLLNHG